MAAATSHHKILVVGATGNIGSCVVDALVKRNVPFRAAIHTASKADSIRAKSSNIEVVVVDLDNAESVSKALVGIEKVFLSQTPNQKYVEQIKNFAAAAKAAGVKHIVYLGAQGSEEPQLFHFAGTHYFSEPSIVEAGISLTSLRPTTFYTNFLYDIATIKGQGKLFKVTNTPISWIANADVAEVAAKALTEAGHEGHTYTLAPPPINFDQVAAIFTQALGKKVEYMQISEEAYAQSVAAFVPAPVVPGLLNMWKYFANGGRNVSSPDLERLLGRKPTGFKEWVEANKAAFL